MTECHAATQHESYRPPHKPPRTGLCGSKVKTEPRTQRLLRAERDCASRCVTPATLHLRLRNWLFASACEVRLDVFIKYPDEVRHDRRALKRYEVAAVDIHRRARIFAC